MIWRLTYCNKKGVEARIDIIKGNRTPVEIVEGSGNPFTMFYRLDKNDKSGHIMTSSADIEIFETEAFNIDDLKTSNETELKVEYFEDNVLTWAGFVLPDFFSKEIGSPNIVRMTASDRLTALKGITLSDLPAKVSLRSLIERCLAQTGLSLGLVPQIQIYQGSTDILESEILSQRLIDVRGRSTSCYDILMSIMVGTNSTIRQRVGQWQVYNKLEHELRTPTIFFDKVEKGAIRTIQPVASSVGVYQEFGGGRPDPDNYDFSQGLTGWTTVGGFSADTDNRSVKGYKIEGGVYVPDYDEGAGLSHLKNANPYQRNVNPIYLESAPISVPYSGSGAVNIEFDINGVGPIKTTQAVMRIAIVAQKGSEMLTLHHGGSFNPMPSTNPPVFEKSFASGFTAGDFTAGADTQAMRVSGTLESDELEGWELKVRIYGGGSSNTILINAASLVMRSSQEVPKGNIFKTMQGANYTKLHDVETTVFGDYITSGLNGYFYNYSIDDTSNLYLPSGEISPPQWKTIFDTTERPLLHHISRQKSSLFSVAHDILKANINVESFDPLAVFQDCKGGKYVVISASFDFLRSEVDVELEQIAYDDTILKRDFIYSYFGEGEEGIKSIGGISGGSGGSTGGGLTPEQLEILSFWKKDPDRENTIFTEMNAYSTKELSAYGVGDGDGGGGSDYERLDTWASYDSSRAGWVLSAFLGNDLNTRVANLENSAGGGGDGTVVSWGTELNGGVDLTVDGISKTLALHSALTDKQDKLIAGSGITIVGNTISSTATGGGGGEFWKLDENGNLYTEYNAYSTGELSAYGAGTGGGGGGGIIETVYGYGNLGQTFNNANLTDTFNAYTINQINTRLVSVESGSALTVNTTGTGNAITSISKSGTVITATKGSTFSLSTHNHDAIYKPIDYVPSWGDVTGKPTTLAGYEITALDVKTMAGLNSNTVAIGQNINAAPNSVAIGSSPKSGSNSVALGVSATAGAFSVAIGTLATAGDREGVLGNANFTYKWIIPGNLAIGKYSSAESGLALDVNGVIKATGGNSTDWNDANSKKHTHSNKTLLDLITQSNINVLAKLSIVNGNLQIDGNAYATGELSAYGVGSGGGGGGGGIIETVYGYGNLGQTFNNANLTDTFNAYTINQINTRLVAVESGSATTVNTTGTGNAITSISKSGNAITANKGSTFSLSTHTHDTLYKPIGYTPTWEEITSKPSTFAPATHTHSNISITAGTGLSGGGALSATLTLSIASTYAPNTSTSLGASKNLNDYRTAGFYHQTANANATTALNYPVARAGSLLVQTAAGVIQTYKVYNSSDVYVRGYYGTTWTAWRKLVNVSDSIPWARISGAPATATTHPTWAQVTDKPSTFAPSTHNHSASNITSGTLPIDRGGTGNTTGLAASATVLATARNINGTSFDGSAAITTARWGTARNISIGGTSKSVNGSANVTWAASEIAANTATRLATSRTLWGQSFNGSANVSGALSGVTTLTASTSVTAPKVIFSAAGWSLEQSGNELVMKHNGVVRQRYLNDGTILATGGITALATD